MLCLQIKQCVRKTFFILSKETKWKIMWCNLHFINICRYYIYIQTVTTAAAYIYIFFFWGKNKIQIWRRLGLRHRVGVAKPSHVGLEFVILHRENKKNMCSLLNIEFKWMESLFTEFSALNWFDIFQIKTEAVNN